MATDTLNRFNIFACQEYAALVTKIQLELEKADPTIKPVNLEGDYSGLREELRNAITQPTILHSSIEKAFKSASKSLWRALVIRLGNIIGGM